MNPDPSPTPSHNYAGIGTPAYTTQLPRRLPPHPSGLPTAPGGRTIHSQTYVPRGTIAHQGFLDLLFYVPGNGQFDLQSQNHHQYQAQTGRDTRWDWEYDEQGRQVHIHDQDGGRAVETVGRRYEDMPPAADPRGPPIRAQAQPRARMDPPAGPRRQPSEATQMLRALSQQPQPLVAGAGPGGGEAAGGGAGLYSYASASVNGLRNMVLDPVVGTLGYIGSTLRSRVGPAFDDNQDYDQDYDQEVDSRGKDLPGLPGTAAGRAVDGVPLPTNKIPRKPVQGVNTAEGGQTQPTIPIAMDGPNRIQRTVRILHPPPAAYTQPLAKGGEGMGMGIGTWKPRGQIGSILLKTQRGPRGLGGQGGGSKFFDTAKGGAVGKGTSAGAGNGATGGKIGVAAGAARPGGLDKRMISWPLDFRHVAHAETEEEALFMLMRWGMDGMGKVADPIWAQAIKDLVKQRAADQQARAIAQSMINRERGLAVATPFQTLRVINGMPSSIYSEATNETLRPPPAHISTPGIQFSSPGLSPGTPTGKSPLSKATPTKASGTHNPFERAFMAPTEEEKDIMTNDREIVIRPTLPLRIKSKRPPLLTANTKLQDLVDEEQKWRLPQVVNPEDIDGLPFPSVTGKEETVTGCNSPTMRAVALTGSTLDREMGEGLQEVFASLPSRLVTPSLPTLEKATSVAIYFETLYHALLKPPKSLDAAHPNNYILNRRRRELALEQEMEKRNCSEQEKTVLRARWREEETQALREKRKKVGTLSFAKLKVIGHGAFGVVSLVKEKETGKLFAMKELRKADMLRKGQEGHVRAEKDLLAAAANSSAGAQWIVKLHYSFQDVDRLYLVLTYEGGGDLLNLLVERDTFEEDFTRFYIAEMILAIEATHKLGFIHRDIKPDNFLFSKEGHLRISDFGLANDLHWAHDTYYYDQQRRALLKKHGIDLEEPSKMKLKTMKRREVEAIMGKDWLNQGQGMLTWRDGKRRKLAMSVCGTNSYMAPEVIRGLGYGFTCDWWSLGCIAFECLYGFPPFVSGSRHQTRQKILNWRESLRFPTKPRLSKACTDFLASLLCEPEDRLGSMATASTNRPNSIMTAERSNPWSKSIGGRNGPRSGLGDDGAADIKAHPWFRGIDWDNIHLQEAPYQPNLIDPADTRHFDDDIPNEPLAPPGGAPAHATKDPMLADRKHGAHILDIRKQMAFAGWTYKGHKQDMEERFEAMNQERLDMDEVLEDQRPSRLTGTVGRNRALSL